MEHTDHDPVEMLFWRGKDWAAEAKGRLEVASSRPNVLRFLGCSAEAAELRVRYAKQVSLALEQLTASHIDWEVVAQVMKQAALKVVGPTPKRQSKPWLKGKETEIACLESKVHVCEEALRKARSAESPQVEGLLHQRRQASQALPSAKRRWEACWWDDLAAKANQAGQDGNDFQFWQVCRQLGFREGERNRHGCRRTVASEDQDREAWKIFLHGIQADQGAVSEAVWQYVPEASHVYQALADIPNKQEFDNALKSMKFGKRGGLDDITVELIRFGGEDLREVVFQVIKEMWQEASDAAEGREAERWTPSSCTGVCIPMLKNKGDRTDKANYRNLVMLSVSAKLVARIAASRLSQWLEEWMPEEQNRFRPGRGIDDVHLVVRRLLEDVSVSAASDQVGFTCFDIVRAYTRVCRVALWQLLRRLGLPESFVRVLRALHDHTSFRGVIHNGYSDPWFTERGLREGCPSSPSYSPSFIMQSC